MIKNSNVRIGLGLACILLIGGAFYFYHSALAAIGNLNIYNGSAEIERGETVITGTTGTTINLRDVIRVPDNSRASIILRDGTEIRLEAGTKIIVSEITYNGKKINNAVFDLLSGRAWSHVAPLEAGQNFRVETPTVVATVRGTDFNISYLESTTKVYVSTHAVWTWLRSHPEKTVQIDAGNFMSINDTSAETDFAAGPKPSTEKDDWTIFNEALDAARPNGSTESPVSNEITNTTATLTINSVPTFEGNTTSKVKLVSLVLTTKFASSAINPNQVIPLLVTANYSDGSKVDVTKQVTWTQSPALDAIDSNGGFHVSSGIGTTSVTALLNGVQSNLLKITIGQSIQSSTSTVTLIGLSVTCQKIPSNSFTNFQLPTAQCKATGTYSNRTTSDLSSQVQWKVSGTAGGSIDTKGLYRPQTQGTATIAAAILGVSGSTQISIP